MRRLLILAILSALVVALSASVALGQSRGPSGADGSYNCEDFDTQEDAQAFYNQDASDPDGLDGPPGDAFTGEQGVACESLPSAADDGQSPSSVPTEDSQAADSPITSRGAETAPLNADGTCPEGFVTVNAPFCAEESPNTPGRIFGYGEGDLATQSPAESQQPAADQYADDDASEMTQLPDTGGPALLPIAGLALIGLGGLILKRR